MRANNAQGKLSDDRQREYQRQQESLKAMAASSEKTQTVSADVMIENLLKVSLKNMSEMPATVEQLHNSYAELPLWLQYNSSAVPAQYKYLWSLVQSTVDLADTQKVSELLLTSGLQVDMLGFIWSLVNKAIPGQLTKQEFYIVLALVGLVQSGYAFNNLNILKLLTVPSMPVLQLGLLKFPVPQSQVLQKAETANYNSTKEFPGFVNLQPKPAMDSNEDESRDHFSGSGVNEINLVKDVKKNVASQKETSESNFMFTIGCNKTQKPHVIEHTKDIYKNSNFPCIGSSPTAELEDDFSAFQSVSVEEDNASKKVNTSVNDSCDDFSDFQSADIEHVDPFETVVVNQKREIPKILLPKTLTGKFTSMKSNILKISPESGKKLKALSAAESLSSLPESKISSNNKVSTCVPVLGSNHGIGSRLANHSFSGKIDIQKCHKHHKIKINPSSPVFPDAESEIILGVKTKNLETVIPKCRPQNSNTYRTFLLKETKIRNDEATESPDNEQLGSELELTGMHSGEQTRQIKIPMLGTFNETVLPTQSKPQISNVDLITVQEDKYSALREIELELNTEKNSDVKEVNDDFGDFLSADISALGTSESSAEVSDSNSNLPSLKNNDKDSWGDWNFSTEMPLNSSNTSSVATPAKNNSPGTDSAPAIKAEDDLFELNLLTFNDSASKISQADSLLSNQQDYFGGDFIYGGAGDGVMFGEKNEKSTDLSSRSKTDQVVSDQLDNEFWGFLSSETKPPVENTSSRHDSLPNLDLNISPVVESEQEIIWKKCIDSCYSLIQKGFDVFNSIVTKSVLDEVFAAPETESYLNNLNIVCQISKRISQNYNAFSSNQNELEKLWGRLQELCFEYNIKLKPDEENFSEGKFRCGICSTFVGRDVVNQGTSSYHPSCANLWINYVDGILPSSV